MGDGAGAFLPYELYNENTHTTAWYDTLGTGGVTWPAFATFGAQNGTVYGRIAAAQDVPAARSTPTRSRRPSTSRP